jgi:TIR domain
MNHRDPHSALKTDVVASSQARGVDLRLVRLQWSKTEIGFSLHAAPNTYGMAGIQLTDFLSYLGFQRSRCPFVDRQECYVRWGEEGFEINAFGQAVVNGFEALKGASDHLQACGFFLPQPEGWGYFQGKPSGARRRGFASGAGDGHTAPKQQRLKTSEDAIFSYILSWLEGGPKGWTFHYRPKHPPLSAEIQAALTFLNLPTFPSCPEFDFEPCHWRFAALESSGDSRFDSNVSYVHRDFDSHAEHFSAGLELLLQAQTAVEPSGFRFLPLAAPAKERAVTEIERRILTPKGNPRRTRTTFDFDVAISFAGGQRPIAEQLASAARDAGFAVFYDAFYPEDLWGKDLVVFFDEIYRKQARFCVILVSQEYIDGQWTNHERRSAQARALQERGNEYILPVKINDVELPGMPPTIGYVSLPRLGIEKITDLLIRKLRPS